MLWTPAIGQRLFVAISASQELYTGTCTIYNGCITESQTDPKRLVTHSISHPAASPPLMTRPRSACKPLALSRTRTISGSGLIPVRRLSQNELTKLGIWCENDLLRKNHFPKFLEYEQSHFFKTFASDSLRCCGHVVDKKSGGQRARFRVRAF